MFSLLYTSHSFCFFRYKETISGFKDGSPLPSDFIKVNCKGGDGQLYENVHQGVHHNPQIRDRVSQKHLSPGNFVQALQTILYIFELEVHVDTTNNSMQIYFRFLGNERPDVWF